MTQSWWDKNLPARLDDFKAWTGGPDAPSRVAARKYIVGKGYGSVLDCGCGLGVDWAAYVKEGVAITWRGVDTCHEFTEEEGAVRFGDVSQAIPARNGEFDVVYFRHVLEHLESYQVALAEAVRVARREVLVVWFLKPEIGREELSYDKAENLHHNRYERGRLEAFVKGLRGVRYVMWEYIGDTECIMHVLLTGAASEAR